MSRSKTDIKKSEKKEDKDKDSIKSAEPTKTEKTPEPVKEQERQDDIQADWLVKMLSDSFNSFFHVLQFCCCCIKHSCVQINLHTLFLYTKLHFHLQTAHVTVVECIYRSFQNLVAMKVVRNKSLRLRV